jgi:hypothetical protein
VAGQAVSAEIFFRPQALAAWYGNLLVAKPFLNRKKDSNAF